MLELHNKSDLLANLADYESFHRRCAEKLDTDSFERFDSLYSAELAADVIKYVQSPESYHPLDESELLTKMRCFEKLQRVVDGPNYCSTIRRTFGAIVQWMTDNGATAAPFLMNYTEY